MRVPAGRLVVPMAVGGTLLVVAGAVVGYLLVRDDASVARGDLIAYSCKEPKNDWYAVCVMRSDGSEKRRLTRQLATTDPAWSADGRRIAFTRNEDVGEFTTFTDDDVFVMDADGGDLEQLTPERDGSTSGQPAWSPDGREIVFVRGPSVASTVSAATALRFGSLLVRRADGGEERRLTRGAPEQSRCVTACAVDALMSREALEHGWAEDQSRAEAKSLTAGACAGRRPSGQARGQAI